MIVSPERLAVTPLSTSNTRLALLPLMVTPVAGPVIVVVSAVLAKTSGDVRVIACRVAKTAGSKLMAERDSQRSMRRVERAPVKVKSVKPATKAAKAGLTVGKSKGKQGKPNRAKQGKHARRR